MGRRPSSSEPRLVLATANPAKAREMAELLGGLGLRVLALTDFPGVTLPLEGEVSYADNALGKARAVAAQTGGWALADDSGIEVDALGGRPGVRSARYGGEGRSDTERCRALLDELRGVPPGRRLARYRCVIALCRAGGPEATVEGVVEGLLLDSARGSGGFGYDPVFYYPPLGVTFAELSPEAKNAVSHRGVAMTRARAVLQRWLGEVPPPP